MNSGLGTIMAATNMALSRLRDRLHRDEGQAFVEYALVLVFIAALVATAALWQPLHDGILNAVNTVKNTLSGAPNNGS